MSRTSITISYRDPYAAKKIIEHTLYSNGFRRATVNNEFVWKGNGLQFGGICVKIEFTPRNTVVLYAWVTSPVEPDHDLSGFRGSVPKRKVMDMLQEIQAKIARS